MQLDFLRELLLSGGVSALSIGVMYLLYSALIKLGIFPKLKQWQAFVLLCLIATFVFVIVLVTLQGHAAPKLAGELPPDLHFQLDANAGVFCDANNVRDAFVTFFDEAEIGISNCADNSQTGASRAYRIDWPPLPEEIPPPENRHNYNQCFVSNFSKRAPVLVDGLDASFNRNHAHVPCEHRIGAFRGIRVTYNDIHNDGKRAAFVQSFMGGKFAIRQVPFETLPDPAAMKSLSVGPDGSISGSMLLHLVQEYDLGVGPVR
jgi:hypothetical protein